MSPQHRKPSIDALRGLVMVLMALDHTRDYWAPTPFDTTDVTETTPAWFFVRWVTHLCAPVFVFLAGTSAWFKGWSLEPRELSRWLVVRGLWLVFLEVAVNNTIWWCGLWFEWGMFLLSLQVLWAIGMSMIALGLLCRLPRAVVVAIGVALVAGHNLLDGVHVDGSGMPLRIAWSILHERGFFPFGAGGDGAGRPAWTLMVLYPLVPWIGVMALGYAFGSWYAAREGRARPLLGLGLALCAAFVLLRGLNVYGDPSRWEVSERGPLYTALDMLACTKYPPSLSFLLMTLGPALVLLAAFERLPARASRVLVVYGRVPLFFYLVHMIAIHGLMLAAAASSGRSAAWWFDVAIGRDVEGYDPALSPAFHVWGIVLFALYPACYAWGLLKASRRHRWAEWL